MSLVYIIFNQEKALLFSSAYKLSISFQHSRFVKKLWLIDIVADHSFSMCAKIFEIFHVPVRILV